jgi:O-antigen biosynthesis protein
VTKRRSKKQPLTAQEAARPSRALLDSAARHRLAGRIAQSLKDYRLALKAENGRSQEALIGIAHCHELQGEPKKAAEFFCRARRLAVLPLEDYLAVARLHSELCAFTDAMEWLKDALFHYPRTEDIHEALRGALESQSRFKQNTELLRQQIKIAPRDRKFAEYIAAHGHPQAYLDRNPDVANAGLGAFFHWLTYGLHEGRILPGIEVSKRTTTRYTRRPWRHFTFRGRALLARTGSASEHAAYETILKAWEDQKDIQSEAIQIFLRGAKNLPLISIVVPVYNTDPALLRATIESVRTQRYANWELCLADDRSSSPEVAPILKEYQAKDERIRVLFRKQNGGISAATNSAISLATGAYIAFLDHDDLLDDCALLCVAKALQENPGAKIIYTDEDKISTNGERYDPHFKPDWNRELFYGQNYISHFTVIKSSVVSQAGKLRSEYNGSQDYDLLLRSIELVKDSEIIHIPKVLYSWRAVAGSAALSRNAKSYAWEAGRRALADHLRRTDDPYTVVERGAFPFSYKPNWMTKHPTLVSVIIPTRDKLHLLKVAVESILAITTDCRFEIIIVDNASAGAETIRWLKRIPTEDSRVRVLRHDIPFNYSALNNFAVSKSRGNVLAFMNNDIEVLHSGWLQEMASLASRPDVGCVGAKLLYPDDTIQHGGVIVGTGGVAGHAFLKVPAGAPGYFYRLQFRQEYSAVTGACMAIRREVFENVNGFNEKDLPVAFNDIDLCLKVGAKGYRNLWTPYATLIHHESASRGKDDTPAKRLRFQRETMYMQRAWNTRRYRDPAYNINLSLHRADFSLGEARWNF